MDWPIALGLALALVAVATAIGVISNARAGRARTASGEADATVAALGLSPEDLGRRATLVQFTSELCAQCVPVARRLDGIASDYDGVRRIEFDLTRRADVAARFRVLQTPTTLVLDAAGAPVARFGGIPRSDAVRGHLDRLTGSPDVAA